MQVNNKNCWHCEYEKNSTGIIFRYIIYVQTLYFVNCILCFRFYLPELNRTEKHESICTGTTLFFFFLQEGMYFPTSRIFWLVWKTRPYVKTLLVNQLACFSSICYQMCSCFYTDKTIVA